jgi:hypothetical protein
VRLAAVKGGRPAEGARRLHLHDHRRRAGLDTVNEDSVTNTENIVLIFRALEDTVPLAVRLRALLKTALRRDRLRCVAVSGLPPLVETRAAEPLANPSKRETIES